jgi:formylglycine-generating enzyme required for sulfatase activity
MTLRHHRLISCLVPLIGCLVVHRPATQAADEAAAKLKTQTVTIEVARGKPLGEKDPVIELVQIPPGTIVLKGADGKDHRYSIKPIWVAKYETRWDEYRVFWLGLDLTSRQWDAVRDEAQGRAGKRKPGQWERPDGPYNPPYGLDEKGELAISGYPASCISFQAAVKYCIWLSKLTGKRFRLPTEAEWEYACRAGGPPIPPMSEKQLNAVAWFAGNSDGRPHAVGKKRPNAWGLYDMLGNVGEYVICDPTDTKGVIAGGTWSDRAEDVHSGAREPYSPQWQQNDPTVPPSTKWFDYDKRRIGFRVVMED